MAADKLAARFRAKAESLQKKIEELRRPRLDNTPKRAREAMSRNIEARLLERVRDAYRTVAQARQAEAIKRNPDLEPLTAEQIAATFPRISEPRHAGRAWVLMHGRGKAAV